MQSRQPGRGTTEPDQQSGSAAATAARERLRTPPGKTAVRGRWDEEETLTRPDYNRRGGEDGAGTEARQVVRRELPELRGRSSSPRASSPLCFGAPDHVTISHGTRICPLPRAAAQQIAAAREPSGRPAEHARAPRLPSASGEAGGARASCWCGAERRLQFRLSEGRPRSC